MRISRTWLLVLLLAVVATDWARAAEKKAESRSEAEAMSDEEGDDDDVEDVETAETRAQGPLPAAEDRVDDRDKRQLPGQPQYIQRLPNLGGSPPQGFRSATPVRERDSEGLVNTLSSTAAPVHLVRQSAQPVPVQVTYRATPSPQALPQSYRVLPTAQPSPAPSAAPQRRVVQQAYSRPQPSRQQYADLQQVSEEASEELEPEKEEPDRLTELLPHSKFSCQGRGTGYYADEGLGCEVFHYCQDSARHSWVCPEGFTFHQVHLICMPPSSDNICQKSSSFFFVNDYLYRPVNEEEVLRKPNVSLRYSDRYYPQNYFGDADEGAPQPQQLQSQQVAQRVPLQQGLPQQRRTAAPAAVPLVQYQSTPRPQAHPQSHGQAHSQGTPLPLQQASYRQANPSNQVFHSPEEVNIPLQLRRPVATTARNFAPTVSSEEEYEDDEPVYRQG